MVLFKSWLTPTICTFFHNSNPEVILNNTKECLFIHLYLSVSDDVSFSYMCMHTHTHMFYRNIIYLLKGKKANRWRNNGNSASFISFGFKITSDCDCSHEIKRCLLLERKVITNLDVVLKNRDITLPRKVCIVKAMVFPIVMYGCESWTIKKAECRRTDAFELWCWRRLLRVPWKQGYPTSQS